MAAPAPLAERFAEFGIEVMKAGLGPDLDEDMRERVTDVLGLQLAARHLDSSAAAEGLVREQGGAPQATIVGSCVGEQVPATGAAFVNGVLAHSLDFDDTYLPSIVHPSASVVPAALAMGEKVHASGRDVCVAIAVGLEITIRIGMAGYDVTERSNIWFDHGQHATSICGTVGSAAAAALLAGLDVHGVVNAIAISTSMAAGVIEANRAGGTVKRTHCGWSAQSGVTAAQLVAHGITGPSTALEGRFGLFEAFLHRDIDVEPLVAGLGQTWEATRIFYKPYPSNHYTHAGIDAAIALRTSGVQPDDIEAMTLGVPRAIVRTIGEPLEVKQNPPTGYAAQFSGPYTVVAGLLGGGGLGVGLDDFTDELAVEPRRRDLMRRVTVVADPRCDNIYPDQFPAFLTVRLRSGRVLERAVTVNRGSPDNPLTPAELAHKFRANAARHIADPARLEALVRCLEGLNQLDDVGALLAAAGAVPAQR